MKHLAWLSLLIFATVPYVQYYIACAFHIAVYIRAIFAKLYLFCKRWGRDTSIQLSIALSPGQVECDDKSHHYEFEFQYLVRYIEWGQAHHSPCCQKWEGEKEKSGYHSFSEYSRGDITPSQRREDITPLQRRN
jgi:hypothetical protein